VSFVIKEPAPCKSDDTIWTYQRRADGRIAVTLDNNLWDFLFERRGSITLDREFPQEQFCIFIPREVEIEHLAIKEHNRLGLRQFIQDTLRACGIVTTGHFGFAASDGELQRSMPFSSGTFMSGEERIRLTVLRERFLRKDKLKGSGLVGNETDISLANSSFTSVVVTGDRSPPLRFAAERGGKVVVLDPEWSYAPQTLRSLIENAFAEGA
jgi:hypothetical protein